jgi:hypothetical protein
LATASLNKWTSLERAKKFTCAHEYEDVGGNCIQVVNAAHAMDLFNNLSGRTYMYNNIGTSLIGTANNIPTPIQAGSAILSTFNGNLVYFGYLGIFTTTNGLNWTNAGQYNSAYNYYTPTQNKLVFLQ